MKIRRNKEKNKSTSKVRYNVISLFVYIIATILLIQLFNLQIVNGASYRETSNIRLTRESILKADRGNIMDSRGNILASVNTEYAIDLYKTLKEDSDLNRLILDLTNLLTANGDKYKDEFLIGINPIRFLLEEESSQIAWKKANNIPEEYNAEQVFDYFKNKYHIDTDNVEDARKIIAIRYEISYRGYSSTKSIRISDNVSLETVHQITEQNDKFPGVTISEDYYRTYPQGKTASHILGQIGKISESELEGKEDIYKNDDIIGKEGIEYVFEKYLKGTDGIKEIDMAVDGTITSEYVAEEAVAGANVILTIDSQLQRITEQALAENINKIADGGFSGQYDADAGAAVVINIKTGEVLAMASYPDYEPSKFVNGIDQDTWNYYTNGDTKPLENKAITTIASPGSTFKMVTAITGLETGAISTTETINDTGVYRKYNSHWNCWIYTDYHTGHGRLNVEDAIKQSCNYFFYEVGDRVGIDALSTYAYYLGLGHKTGVELKNESAGILSSRAISDAENRSWNPGDTISSAIGQSYNSFTPIQMAKYIATLVSGGQLKDITIVKSVVKSDGSEVPRSEWEAYVKERLGLEDENIEPGSFSEENVRSIMEGMRNVTSESGGTAYSIFKGFNISVGGKTGSAQTGIAGKTNAWFVGFAPFEDPEIAIAVFVRNGGHGSYIAEVARDIIAEYFGMNTERIYEDNSARPSVEMIN